jgi:hypothetical protein
VRVLAHLRDVQQGSRLAPVVRLARTRAAPVGSAVRWRRDMCPCGGAWLGQAIDSVMYDLLEACVCGPLGRFLSSGLVTSIINSCVSIFLEVRACEGGLMFSVRGSAHMSVRVWCVCVGGGGSVHLLMRLCEECVHVRVGALGARVPRRAACVACTVCGMLCVPVSGRVTTTSRRVRVRPRVCAPPRQPHATMILRNRSRRALGRFVAALFADVPAVVARSSAGGGAGAGGRSRASSEAGLEAATPVR